MVRWLCKLVANYAAKSATGQTALAVYRQNAELHKRYGEVMAENARLANAITTVHAAIEGDIKRNMPLAMGFRTYLSLAASSAAAKRTNGRASAGLVGSADGKNEISDMLEAGRIAIKTGADPADVYRDMRLKQLNQGGNALIAFYPFDWEVYGRAIHQEAIEMRKEIAALREEIEHERQIR